jgi:hypothetical protein
MISLPVVFSVAAIGAPSDDFCNTLKQIALSAEKGFDDLRGGENDQFGLDIGRSWKTNLQLPNTHDCNLLIQVNISKAPVYTCLARTRNYDQIVADLEKCYGQDINWKSSTARKPGSPQLRVNYVNLRTRVEILMTPTSVETLFLVFRRREDDILK